MALQFVKDFQAFITKGNVLELAVAFVMGAAFNTVVTGFVSDIITPLIGIAGHFDFSTLQYTINGSTFLLGTFINSLISFVILSLVIFFLVVRPVGKLVERSKPKNAPGPATKVCPQCLSTIPLKAKRCAFCTSKVT